MWLGTGPRSASMTAHEMAEWYSSTGDLPDISEVSSEICAEADAEYMRITLQLSKIKAKKASRRARIDNAPNAYAWKVR